MNTSPRDFYSILGVRPDASAAEFKNMRDKLAKKYHADVNSNDPDLARWSHERMVELNLAYETLSDPERKTDYDLTLKTGEATQPDYAHYGQNVRIETKAQAREILLNLAHPYQLGAPTPELEAAAKKEMVRLLTKRTSRYIQGALPDEYPMSYLTFAVEKAANDAIERLCEMGIHRHVQIPYLLLIAIVGIAAAIRLAEGFFQGVVIALSSLLFSAGYFQLAFLMARFMARGFGYSLVGTRGYYVNGTIALLLVGLLVARRFMWQ